MKAFSPYGARRTITLSGGAFSQSYQNNNRLQMTQTNVRLIWLPGYTYRASTKADAAVRPGELEAESFDAAGNLTKAGVLRLEYDGENRLAKAVGSGSTVYEYVRVQ
jgi:hypothetical protein